MGNSLEKNKQESRPIKKVVVIYHKDCSDGFGGAWAAWKKFGSTADYIGINPSASPIPELKNKEIYLVDVSYKPEEIKKLIRINKRVTIIDHHLTAEKAAKLTQAYSYDIKHSGAVLAWQYFHPKKTAPKLLLHVEDRDIWKFRLPRTKEITAFLDLFDFEFKVWDSLAKLIENSRARKKAIEKGATILVYEDKLVKQMIRNNAERVRFEGYRILAVNSPNFASQIGNTLLKIMPPIAIIWSERAGKIIVSLRSDDTVDVSKIAKKYGGGGHKAAAGFSFLVNKRLPWKILDNT